MPINIIKKNHLNNITACLILLKTNPLFAEEIQSSESDSDSDRVAELESKGKELEEKLQQLQSQLDEVRTERDKLEKARVEMEADREEEIKIIERVMI